MRRVRCADMTGGVVCVLGEVGRNVGREVSNVGHDVSSMKSEMAKFSENVKKLLEGAGDSEGLENFMGCRGRRANATLYLSYTAPATTHSTSRTTTRTAIKRPRVSAKARSEQRTACAHGRTAGYTRSK